MSFLIGTVTTLAIRGYLTRQLDQDVDNAIRGAQFQRADGGGPFGGAQTGDGPRGDPGTLSAVHIDGASQWWVGSVGTQRSTGEYASSRLSATISRELNDVPVDGRGHTVDLDGLGSYRVVVSADGTAAAGLPTEDVDDVVGNLIWWEVLLALLAVGGAGGAAAIVVRRQLRPLREVAATAHNVAGLPLAEGEIAIAPRVPAHLQTRTPRSVRWARR